MRTAAAWHGDDDDLLLLVAAVLRPTTLTRDDVVAAGRDAYTWLAVMAARADVHRPAEADHKVSTRPPPPD